MAPDEKIKIHAKASRKIPAIWILAAFALLAFYQGFLAPLMQLPHLDMGGGMDVGGGADVSGGVDEKLAGAAVFFAILCAIAIYQFKYPAALLILDRQGFQCRVSPKAWISWDDVVRVKAQSWANDHMLVPVLKPDAAIFENTRFKRSVKGKMNRRRYDNSIVISAHLLEKSADDVARIMMQAANASGRLHSQ